MIRYRYKRIITALLILITVFSLCTTAYANNDFGDFKYTGETKGTIWSTSNASQIGGTKLYQAATAVDGFSGTLTPLATSSGAKDIYTKVNGVEAKGIRFSDGWEPATASNLSGYGVKVPTGETTFSNMYWVIPGEKYDLLCQLISANNRTGTSTGLFINTNSSKTGKVEQYGMVMVGYEGYIGSDWVRAISSTKYLDVIVNIKVCNKNSISSAGGVYTGKVPSELPWCYMRINDIDAGQSFRSYSKGFSSKSDKGSTEGIIIDATGSSDIFNGTASVPGGGKVSCEPYTVRYYEEGTYVIKTYDYTFEAYTTINLTAFYKGKSASENYNTVFAQYYSGGKGTDITSGNANIFYQIGQTAGNEGGSMNDGETICFGFTSPAESNIDIYAKVYKVEYNMKKLGEPNEVSEANKAGLALTSTNNVGGIPFLTNRAYETRDVSEDDPKALKVTLYDSTQAGYTTKYNGKPYYFYQGWQRNYAGNKVQPVTATAFSGNHFLYWIANVDVMLSDGYDREIRPAGYEIEAAEFGDIVINNDITFTAVYASEDQKCSVTYKVTRPVDTVHADKTSYFSKTDALDLIANGYTAYNSSNDSINLSGDPTADELKSVMYFAKTVEKYYSTSINSPTYTLESTEIYKSGEDVFKKEKFATFPDDKTDITEILSAWGAYSGWSESESSGSSIDDVTFNNPGSGAQSKTVYTHRTVTPTTFKINYVLTDNRMDKTEPSEEDLKAAVTALCRDISYSAASVTVGEPTIDGKLAIDTTGKTKWYPNSSGTKQWTISKTGDKVSVNGSVDLSLANANYVNGKYVITLSARVENKKDGVVNTATMQGATYYNTIPGSGNGAKATVRFVVIGDSTYGYPYEPEEEAFAEVSGEKNKTVQWDGYKSVKVKRNNGGSEETLENGHTISDLGATIGGVKIDGTWTLNYWYNDKTQSGTTLSGKIDIVFNSEGETDDITLYGFWTFTPKTFNIYSASTYLFKTSDSSEYEPYTSLSGNSFNVSGKSVTAKFQYTGGGASVSDNDDAYNKPTEITLSAPNITSDETNGTKILGGGNTLTQLGHWEAAGWIVCDRDTD